MSEDIAEVADMNGSGMRTLAAFAAGVTAWEALVHFSLLVSRSSPRVLGIRLLPRVNAIQTIVPAVLAVALALYAWRREGAPAPMRWAARQALSGRVPPATLDAVLRRADRAYLEVAPADGPARSRAGAINVRMAAYLLALERSFIAEGVTQASARELLRTGLFAVMRAIWKVPDAILERVGPKDAIERTRLRQRIAQRLYFRDPDWSMREVAADHGFGIDVERCVMADYLASHGAASLCADVLCAQDLLMASARGELLERTGTIAGGAARCDFRFSRPAPAIAFA